MTKIRLRWSWPLVVGLLAAGTAYGEDLNDVYRLARQHDPVVAAALEKREGAREGIAQSQASLLPQVWATAQRSRVLQHTMDQDKYNVSSQALNLKVPLWHWDNWIGLRMAEKQDRQAELMQLDQEQGLIFRVTKAYLDILLAEETLALRQSEDTAMSRQLEIAQERLKVGEAVITDVQEAQAWRDLSATNTLAAVNQLASQRESLAEIIASLPEKLKPLKAEIPLEKPDPDNLDTWMTTAREHSFSLQVARLGVAIAQDKLEQAHAGHYPTVDLIAGRNHQDSEASPQWMGGPSKTDNLMVQLNVPIYAGGMVVSRERQGLRDLNQRKLELEQTDRQVVHQARDAYRAIVTSIAQVRAFQQAVKSAELALSSTREGVAAGLRNTLDVLTAEREYHQSRRNHASARYEYLLAALRLKQACGTLTEGDLQRINGWLQ
ncbi:MAG: TolC family outer membrane protein [Magnetococcales bacterium]|nr:TolC family outer membrane protein [Magnetococcales bacterium]NGZ28316.1 TolC family outer membrane protein [Magnetococcales bacterium]